MIYFWGIKLMKNILVATLVCFSFASYAEDSVWKAACVTADDASSSSQVEFAGANMIMSGAYYNDASCGTSTLEYKYNATFAFGATIGTEGDRELNVTYVDVLYKPMTEDMAKQFNTDKVCGITDWIAGEYKNVAGKKCGETPEPDAGSKYYDMVRITADSFMYGETDAEHDGSTPEKRPVKVSTAVVFKKI